MIARIPPGPLWPTEFPEQLASIRTELETYYRELPRLLDEGEEGRYLVVKGNAVHGAWDTLRDAIQYGHDRFGLEPFITQEVDARYLPVYEKWFGPLPATDEEAA